MAKARRLLTVGHSYVVTLNRRLAHEMAQVGKDRWDVTVAAPNYISGDLRPITLETFPDEACRLVRVNAYLSQFNHLMFYGSGLRSLLREQWDLVHCWEEPYIFSGGQVAYWAGSNPLVYYTFQNLDKRYPTPIAALERWCGRRCAAWIAAGQTVESVVKHRAGGYGQKPHRVIPLGIDPEFFRPEPAARAEILRRLAWTPDGPPIIGVLGRFVPEKGIPLLQRALSRLKTPWRALFVGGGTMERELRDWAATQGNRVRVVTGVSHDEVPPYLNAMDILAAPSQTTANWREQLGRMLLEAFACGVPVVGSNSGEIPFVVSDAGIIVGENDELAWTETLSKLLESPVLRAEYARRGLDRARSDYTWPVIARRHLEFFDEVLDLRSSMHSS